MNYTTSYLQKPHAHHITFDDSKYTEVTFDTRYELEKIFQKFESFDIANIILDFKHITDIDSTGLYYIITLGKHQLKHNQKLYCLNLDDHWKRKIQRIGLGKILTLIDSIEDITTD